MNVLGWAKKCVKPANNALKSNCPTSFWFQHENIQHFEFCGGIETKFGEPFKVL